MKIGFNMTIDVTKLEKSRFCKGKKGTYAKLTGFIDTDETSQYGDNGTITQELSKEDRDNGVKLPILGNAKVFWQNCQSKSTNKPAQQNNGDMHGDVPF